MADASNGKRFDSARAEIFETLGHPVRIKILESLESGPLGFADLKRGAGLESSGNLQFHLGKLGDMVSVTPEGNYVLTDEGREALRIVASVSATKPTMGNRDQLLGRVSVSRSVLALLVAALILASSVAVYQQYQLGTLQSQVGTTPTYGTTTVGTNDYWYMRLPAASIAPDTSILFHGVKFSFMPGQPGVSHFTEVWTANGTVVDLSTVASACGNISDVRSIGWNATTFVITFVNLTACPIVLGNNTISVMLLPDPTTVVVNFPDGAVEALTSGWPFANAPTFMNSTLGLVRNGTALAGVGSPWLSTHISPAAAVLLNPDNGTITIYVRDY